MSVNALKRLLILWGICRIYHICHQGGCLAMMERLSACGPVLASLDPDCYSWAREASGPPDHVEVRKQTVRQTEGEIF